MLKVTPAELAEALTEFWSQQVIGAANGNLFKVAKGIGSTTWHKHEDQDETFLVLRGELTVQLRSGNIVLEEGDLLSIPRGVEHCPFAATEVHLLVIGPEVTSTPAGGKPDWSARRPGPAAASATIGPSTHDGAGQPLEGGKIVQVEPAATPPNLVDRSADRADGRTSSPTLLSAEVPRGATHSQP